MFIPMALFAQQTLVPVSATIKDAQGTYTSEYFDCPNMTVWDKEGSVMISWAGDEVPLKQSVFNKDTYKQFGTVDNQSVEIVAHRNSSTRKIFMVTVKMKIQQGSVTITIKEQDYMFLACNSDATLLYLHHYRYHAYLSSTRIPMRSNLH